MLASVAKSIVREYVEAFIIAVVLAAFIITFIAQSFLVDGRSMEPTLHDGQRLMVNKFIYRFAKPKYGDIVVFKYPSNPAKKFIKRVIAVPGDTVEIRDYVVYVNDMPLKEDYILDVTRGRYAPQIVPEGSIFVLGDNRNNSDDSRYSDVGFVPYNYVVGKAFLIYWPLKSARIIRFDASGR